jgi:hypothetical protein
MNAIPGIRKREFSIRPFLSNTLSESLASLGISDLRAETDFHTVSEACGTPFF